MYGARIRHSAELLGRYEETLTVAADANAGFVVLNLYGGALTETG